MRLSADAARLPAHWTVNYRAGSTEDGAVAAEEEVANRLAFQLKTRGRRGAATKGPADPNFKTLFRCECFSCDAFNSSAPFHCDSYVTLIVWLFFLKIFYSSSKEKAVWRVIQQSTQANWRNWKKKEKRYSWNWVQRATPIIPLGLLSHEEKVKELRNTTSVSPKSRMAKDYRLHLHAEQQWETVIMELLPRPASGLSNGEQSSSASLLLPPAWVQMITRDESLHSERTKTLSQKLGTIHHCLWGLKDLPGLFPTPPQWRGGGMRCS